MRMATVMKMACPRHVLVEASREQVRGIGILEVGPLFERRAASTAAQHHLLAGLLCGLLGFIPIIKAGTAAAPQRDRRFLLRVQVEPVEGERDLGRLLRLSPHGFPIFTRLLW